jgi:hypothetical protein
VEQLSCTDNHPHAAADHASSGNTVPSVPADRPGAQTALIYVIVGDDLRATNSYRQIRVD